MPVPKNRVELHIHLDGAARRSTIYELSKTKDLPLPGDGSFEAFCDAVVVKKPCTLAIFLGGFKWIQPAFSDDPEALGRITYEICEDKARDGVLYLEMRLSPHLVVTAGSSCTPADAVRGILTGMHRAEKDFGIKARLILCTIRFLPDLAMEVVDLCDQFRHEGVVGIDVAGDEAADVDKHNVEHFNPLIVRAFEEARRRGIHRTVHAGEAGPANGVKTAVDLLGAERIGHGYHVLEDSAIYQEILKARIHLENCPFSSVLTGAVKEDGSKWPMLCFAEDNANFSISTDDPTITDSTISREYELVTKWGLTAAHIVQANLNAIHSAFLPENEKQELLDKYKKTLTV